MRWLELKIQRDHSLAVIIQIKWYYKHELHYEVGGYLLQRVRCSKRESEIMSAESLRIPSAVTKIRDRGVRMQWKQDEGAYFLQSRTREWGRSDLLVVGRHRLTAYRTRHASGARQTGSHWADIDLLPTEPDMRSGHVRLARIKQI